MGFGIIKKPKTGVSVEKLKQLFPGKKGTITEETADMINKAGADPMFNGDEFIDQMVSYRNVMESNAYSIKEYINALKFCAYLEAEGDNYTEAYKRARATDEYVMARTLAPTNSSEYKELSSTASRYRKTPLVKKILTQSDMPLYLMFQGERYNAVAQLAKEMVNAEYSKDRISAADKLLTHVKPPDETKIELEVGMNETSKSVQESLNEQLIKVAMNQKMLFDAGMTIGEVQQLKVTTNIIDAEVVE